MYKVIYLFLALFICSVLPVAAAGNFPTDIWNFYHFDGTAFTPGPSTDGTAYLAVREKLRPVLLANQTSDIEQTVLPDGSGVITGICYLQSSGGKLTSGAGFKPNPRMPLLISTGGKEFVTVLTDDQGYFTVVLPAGTYSVGSGMITAKITVERGVTTLVPLRVGKRMVD